MVAALESGLQRIHIVVGGYQGVGGGMPPAHDGAHDIEGIG